MINININNNILLQTIYSIIINNINKYKFIKGRENVFQSLKRQVKPKEAKTGGQKNDRRENRMGRSIREHRFYSA
jgi:hypothetical protein